MNFAVGLVLVLLGTSIAYASDHHVIAGVVEGIQQADSYGNINPKSPRASIVTPTKFCARHQKSKDHGKSAVRLADNTTVLLGKFCDEHASTGATGDKKETKDEKSKDKKLVAKKPTKTEEAESTARDTKADKKAKPEKKETAAKKSSAKADEGDEGKAEGGKVYWHNKSSESGDVYVRDGGKDGKIGKKTWVTPKEFCEHLNKEKICDGTVHFYIDRVKDSKKTQEVSVKDYCKNLKALTACS